MKKTLQTALRALFLVAAAGCADIEAARDAQDPAKRPPGERPATAQEVGLRPGATLTLDRALDIARVWNPTVALSRRQVEAAAARLDQISAGRWPDFSANSSFDLSRVQGPPVTSKSLGAGVSISQLLWDFGQTDALVRQSAESLLAAELADRTARIDLAFSCRQAFHDLLRQADLVKVNEDSVAQFEKRLEQVKAFVQVGARIPYDQTKAEVDLGNARLALARSRASLAVGRATLNGILGLTETPAYEVVRPAAPEDWTATPSESSARAMKDHPRLLQQAAFVGAASAGVDAAVDDLFPHLSLGGSVSWSGNATPLTWAASLGPVANWLLYGGGAPSARLREATAGLRQAHAVRARTEEDVYLAVQKAAAALADARERRNIATLTVRQAEENERLAEGRYAVGRASSVELTDAQLSLVTARTERIQADFDHQIAVAQMKQAVGLEE